MKVIYDNKAYYIQKFGGVSVVFNELQKRALKDADMQCRFVEYGEGGNSYQKSLNIPDNLVIQKSPKFFDLNRLLPVFMQVFEENHEDVFPTLICNWDHTPRSKEYGYLYTHATPKVFQRHCEDVLSRIAHKPAARRIAFLKSWNEWGEGNYMEPDLRYGHGYLDALHEALSEIDD